MQVTYGLLEPFQHGRGFQELIAAPSPAAGADFLHKLPGKYVSRLIACSFQLTTSSNAGNRFSTIGYATNAGTVYTADGPAIATAASATSAQFYGTMGRGSSEGATGSATFFGLWGGFLYPGFEVQINVAGIDGTDQLAAIYLLFERFETGEAGYPIGAMDSGVYRDWLESLSS